jgi:hypothetical protein
MAKGNPTVQLRIDPEVRERWVAEAERRGVTLAEFVRGCVENILAGPSGEYQVTMTGAPSRNTAAATGVVVCRNQQRHRKGQRCGYCGWTG